MSIGYPLFFFNNIIHAHGAFEKSTDVGARWKWGVGDFEVLKWDSEVQNLYHLLHCSDGLDGGNSVFFLFAHCIILGDNFPARFARPKVTTSESSFRVLGIFNFHWSQYFYFHRFFSEIPRHPPMPSRFSRSRLEDRFERLR